MNLFCRLLGHTWVPLADNPKTTWNVDKSGLLLVGTPAGTVKLWEECARCKQRREVAPRRVYPTAAPVPEEEAAESEAQAG
jgi:hypothetical protein